MKKLFLLAAMAIASLGMNTQNEAGQFSIKPMAGVNAAFITNADGQDGRWGLAAGVEAEYALTEKFSLSAGALYSMQGTKGEGAEMKYDYINVPILANFYVFDGLSVKAGIQPGFLASAKNKSEGEELDVKEICNKIDFSIPIGVSYEISNFVIDARYNLGLTELIKSDYRDFDESLKDHKNSVFTLSIGYKFKL